MYRANYREYIPGLSRCLRSLIFRLTGIIKMYLGAVIRSIYQDYRDYRDHISGLSRLSRLSRFRCDRFTVDLPRWCVHIQAYSSYSHMPWFWWPMLASITNRVRARGLPDARARCLRLLEASVSAWRAGARGDAGGLSAAVAAAVDGCVRYAAASAALRCRRCCSAAAARPAFAAAAAIAARIAGIACAARRCAVGSYSAGSQERGAGQQRLSDAKNQRGALRARCCACSRAAASTAFAACSPCVLVCRGVGVHSVKWSCRCRERDCSETPCQGMRGRAQCFVPVNVRVLAGRSLRALRQDAVAHARAAAARLGKVGGMGPSAARGRGGFAPRQERVTCVDAEISILMQRKAEKAKGQDTVSWPSSRGGQT